MASTSNHKTEDALFFPAGDHSIAVRIMADGSLVFYHSAIRGHYCEELTLTAEQWDDIQAKLVRPHKRKTRAHNQP